MNAAEYQVSHGSLAEHVDLLVFSGNELRTVPAIFVSLGQTFTSQQSALLHLSDGAQNSDVLSIIDALERAVDLAEEEVQSHLTAAADELDRFTSIVHPANPPQLFSPSFTIPKEHLAQCMRDHAARLGLLSALPLFEPAVPPLPLRSLRRYALLKVMLDAVLSGDDEAIASVVRVLALAVQWLQTHVDGLLSWGISGTGEDATASLLRGASCSDVFIAQDPGAPISLSLASSVPPVASPAPCSADSSAPSTDVHASSGSGGATSDGRPRTPLESVHVPGTVAAGGEGSASSSVNAVSATGAASVNAPSGTKEPPTSAALGSAAGPTCGETITPGLPELLCRLVYCRFEAVCLAVALRVAAASSPLELHEFMQQHVAPCVAVVNLADIGAAMGLLLADREVVVPHVLPCSDTRRIIAARFERALCLAMDLPVVPHLASIMDAGCSSLPTLRTLKNLPRSLRLSTDASPSPGTVPNDMIPMGDLPHHLAFRNQFVCPITHSLASPEDTPIVLPCGHMLSTGAVMALTVNMSRTRVKCPYCPRPFFPTDIVQVSLV